MDQLIDFIAQPSCLRPTIINLTGQIDIRNIHLSFNHQSWTILLPNQVKVIVLVLIKTRNLTKLKRRCYKVGKKWKEVDKFNYKLDPALSGLKDPWQKVKNRSNLRIFYPVCNQLLFQGLFSEKGAPLSKWKRKSERIWLKKIYYWTVYATTSLKCICFWTKRIY